MTILRAFEQMLGLRMKGARIVLACILLAGLLRISPLSSVAVGTMRGRPSDTTQNTGKQRERNGNNKSKGNKTGRSKSESKSSARQRARKAIRSGDLELAKALLRSGLKTKSRAERDAWRVVEAELEYAGKNYAKAGLVAMRIVILRPKSQQVGAALYWAGRAYEGLQRPQKSIELYEACLKHESTKRSIRQKAEKRLAKLKEQSTQS